MRTRRTGLLGSPTWLRISFVLLVVAEAAAFMTLPARTALCPVSAMAADPSTLKARTFTALSS
jgi:hypothetical protein